MSNVTSNYSVKSNQQQLAFKGKFNRKASKVLEQVYKSCQFAGTLKGENVSKGVKKEFLIREMMAKPFSTLKMLSKLFIKK